VFEAFTFAFEETEAGWVWAHAYRFGEGLSTFIVEMAPDTWARLGLDRMDQSEAIALCERIFARYLDGNALVSNAQHLPGPQAWLQFRRILCERWSYRNLILLGDAAHTAHFSIGSGTKLALEDSIKLAEVLNRPGLSRERALDEYQAERNLEVLKLQNSARNSTEWFETLDRYLHFEPIQFAYSLLTRSQRVSHENLRLRDKPWLEGVERWFQSKALGVPVNDPAPPMFAPYRLRGLELSTSSITAPAPRAAPGSSTPR
jgi:anthraniloyl-CoA monooxygenase